MAVLRSVLNQPSGAPGTTNASMLLEFGCLCWPNRRSQSVSLCTSHATIESTRSSICYLSSVTGGRLADFPS